MLHQKIAIALNWPIEKVTTLSFHSLRELVRPIDKELADRITAQIQSGAHIIGKPKMSWLFEGGSNSDLKERNLKG